MAFASIDDRHAFRQVGCNHILAWRRDLEQRVLGGATIRRKLSTLSSLCNVLCESNPVHGNPVDGVKQPKVNSSGRLDADHRRPPDVRTAGSACLVLETALRFMRKDQQKTIRIIWRWLGKRRECNRNVSINLKHLG